MAHHVMVEDELVRETGKEKIKSVNSNERYDTKREELARDIISRPCRDKWKCG